MGSHTSRYLRGRGSSGIVRACQELFKERQDRARKGQDEVLPGQVEGKKGFMRKPYFKIPKKFFGHLEIRACQRPFNEGQDRDDDVPRGARMKA